MTESRPNFTRKHYRQIAAALQAQKPPVTEPAMCYQWEGSVEELAATLARDNERFSYEKFYEACGYPADPR
jgi:type IV secretory pathway VirB9-like protein